MNHIRSGRQLVFQAVNLGEEGGPGDYFADVHKFSPDTEPKIFSYYRLLHYWNCTPGIGFNTPGVVLDFLETLSDPAPSSFLLQGKSRTPINLDNQEAPSGTCS
jgi:hypothetical protein